MLAYHKSVFLLFVVLWQIGLPSSQDLLAKFSKRWTASSIIFAGVLNLSQGLFILVLLSFHTYHYMNVCQKEHQFSYVLSEIWCYIFLFETVFIGRQHFMHILEGCSTLNLCTFLSPMSFSQVNYTTTSIKICAVWVTQRHAIAFLKSVKQESNFSQTFE